ncbi:uncharacterized protein LOC135370847 [Ornithodoros turicata]|uniref:uncharacterized protein LOC135370847 n=1 Tax=Ornithodoros turicata TaxID=34597 RepID=UPI0031389E7D
MDVSESSRRPSDVVKLVEGKGDTGACGCSDALIEQVQHEEHFEERSDTINMKLTSQISEVKRQQENEGRNLLTEVITTDIQSIETLQNIELLSRSESAARVLSKTSPTTIDTVESSASDTYNVGHNEGSCTNPDTCPMCEVSEVTVVPQQISNETYAIPRVGLISSSRTAELQNRASFDVSVQVGPVLCSRGVQTEFNDNPAPLCPDTAEDPRGGSDGLMERIEVLRLSEGLLLAQVGTMETERRELQCKSRRLRDELQAWQETVQQQRVLLEQLREEMEHTESILSAERQASDDLRQQLHALQEELRTIKAHKESQINEGFLRAEDVRLCNHEGHASGESPFTVKRLARTKHHVTAKGSCDCFHEYYESVKGGCICDDDSPDPTQGQAIVKRQVSSRVAKKEKLSSQTEEEKLSVIGCVYKDHPDVGRQTRLVGTPHNDATGRNSQKRRDAHSAHRGTRSPQQMLDLLRMQNELERKMREVRKTEQQLRVVTTPKRNSKRSAH